MFSRLKELFLLAIGVYVCPIGGHLSHLEEKVQVKGMFDTLWRANYPAAATMRGSEAWRHGLMHKIIAFRRMLSMQETQLDRWLDLTRVTPEARQTIHAALTQDLQGFKSSGMRPYTHEQELKFLHAWLIVVGMK
jgi:hypothetical protein